MTEFRIGDCVKVEYTGVVAGVWNGSRSGREFIHVRRDDGTLMRVLGEYATVIEPEYEVGAVYRSASGALFFRLGRAHNTVAWRDVATGLVGAHSVPTRPLVKLVPEVTS